MALLQRAVGLRHLYPLSQSKAVYSSFLFARRSFVRLAYSVARPGVFANPNLQLIRNSGKQQNRKKLRILNEEEEEPERAIEHSSQFTDENEEKAKGKRENFKVEREVTKWFRKQYEEAMGIRPIRKRSEDSEEDDAPKEEQNKDVNEDEDAEDGNDGDQSDQEVDPTRPFISNPEFRAPRNVVGYSLQTLIFNDYVSNPIANTTRKLALKYSLSIREVTAAIRLKYIEQDMLQKNQAVDFEFGRQMEKQMNVGLFENEPPANDDVDENEDEDEDEDEDENKNEAEDNNETDAAEVDDEDGDPVAPVAPTVLFINDASPPPEKLIKAVHELKRRAAEKKPAPSPPTLNPLEHGKVIRQDATRANSRYDFIFHKTLEHGRKQLFVLHKDGKMRELTKEAARSLRRGLKNNDIV